MPLRQRRHLLVAGLWLIVPVGALGQPGLVRLATHDQAPYGSYVDTPQGRVFDGLAVRVVTCAFKAMGRPVSIEVYPWERAQQMAERGEVHGFFPATLKPERLRWAAVTDVVAEQKWVWYLRPDSPLDPTQPDFKARAAVGAHLGSNRLKMLEEQGYRIVLRPPTDDALLRAFMHGRADAVLGGDLAMAEAMRKQQVDPARLRTVVAQDNPLYVYFGQAFLQAEPGFLGRFNAQLAGCR